MFYWSSEFYDCCLKVKLIDKSSTYGTVRGASNPRPSVLLLRGFSCNKKCTQAHHIV